MNHKVLLADDSLTIQKVIKITLANQPYDLIDTPSEDELFKQLSVVQPKLVFLDFNLSEKHTGYELTAKIKSILPAAKVLLLLGTFDTVDEAAMEKCGASDKIVKPFDSNKFIAICKQLIDAFEEEETIEFPGEHHQDIAVAETSADQWTMSHAPEVRSEAPVLSLDDSFPNLKNPLLQGVSDWSMSVPGIINAPEKEKMAAAPPVIGELKSLDDHRSLKSPSRPTPNQASSDPKYPDNSDLDYPTIEEMETEARQDATAPAQAPTSKLISIDSFHDADATGELILEGAYISQDSDVKSIEAQIRDEVEEDLWHADEFEDLKNEISEKIEDVKTNFQPTLNDFDESLFKPLDDSESITWQDSSDLTKEEPKDAPVQVGARPLDQAALMTVKPEEVKRELEELVKKHVKEYMDQLFQKNAEKVAWEVIPDLAENLIRQELSKITNKILNEQG